MHCVTWKKIKGRGGIKSDSIIYTPEQLCMVNYVCMQTHPRIGSDAVNISREPDKMVCPSV